MDDLSTGLKENIIPFFEHPHFHFEEKNILLAPLDEAVAWSDKIYHMAAWVGQSRVLTHQIETLHENIVGCERLLHAIAKSKKNTRLLISSSSSVYGHQTQPLCQEESILHIQTTSSLQEAYPLSKLVNEITALSYVREKKVDCCIARIFNTVGHGQRKDYGMCVPTFVDQALHNKPITVFGNGSQMRSFCNVRDTVAACYLLLENPHSKGKIVNIGINEEISINDLAILVKKLTKTESPILQVPYKEAYGITFEECIFRQIPSLDKLKELTGFIPSISIEKTIEEMISKA
jgi:UDP-glucose 4-epimerase